jgi:CheY-like chemotaxis protein
MVVEDEPNVYELLLAMFALWGIEGRAFVDGEEAVAWIDDVDAGRFRGELPELALLDFYLPNAVQGDDVARRLRASPKLRGMAIVMVTAWRFSPGDERRIRSTSGIDELIYKPLPDFGPFKQRLERTLEQRRARNAQLALEESRTPAIELAESVDEDSDTQDALAAGLANPPPPADTRAQPPQRRPLGPRALPRRRRVRSTPSASTSPGTGPGDGKPPTKENPDA